jgi:hypothetical protein
MSACMCCAESLRRLGKNCGGGDGCSRTLLPFKAGMLGPQIAVALFTSSGRALHFRNVPALSAEISYESDGNPRIACSRRADTHRATSRLEYSYCLICSCGRQFSGIKCRYFQADNYRGTS